jgi:pimeloyl-[acyl-carrier protein] methyl ester esterase
MKTFHDQGTGPAVVVLPGLAATAGTMRTVIEDLAVDHRVITIELPGHGAHRPAVGSASLAGAVRHVHEVVRAQGIAPFTLLGWSLGATVAYRYLEQYGDAEVVGLISVDQTPCLVTDGSWPYAAFGSLDRAGAEGLKESIVDDYGTFVNTLVHASFAADETPAASLVAAHVAQAHQCEPTAVRALFADAALEDWRDRIRAIQTRTLLIHGARSQVYPGGVGPWLETAMTAARLDLFENSGHLPFIEERERFDRAVRDFVTSTSSVPGAADV